MARRRHAQKNSSTRATPARKSHLEKLRKLSRAGRRPDPTNKRAVARAYAEIKRKETLVKHYGKSVTPSQAKLLKQKGFYVIGNKVIVDVPRNVRREKIPHTKFSVLRSGVVKYTNTERRDYIIGLNKREREDFARDPDGFTKRKLAEFKKQNPTAAAHWKTRQVRLQWGAFQGTKAFTPTYFSSRYLLEASPEDIRKVGKRKARRRLDNLTGLHIVLYVPSKRRKTKKKKTRGAKRRRR